MLSGDPVFGYSRFDGQLLDAEPDREADSIRTDPVNRINCAVGG
jgi:hypothetical protein